MARLITCEAGGEGLEGMQAVASVIMNRVNVPYGEYAQEGMGSLRRIIFQPGQFACAETYRGGAYNPQNIYNVSPDPLSYEVADWAIVGNRLLDLGEALWFYNPFSPTCRQNFPGMVGQFVLRIGDHCFYNPTALYAET